MNLVETIDVYAGGVGSGCHGPNCGRPISSGDTVKLKKPVTLWNTKTGDNDKFPAGQKAIVVDVLPKIGTADQMVKVNIVPPTKNHEGEEQHVKMSDVEFEKSGLTHQVNPIGHTELPMYTNPKFHPTGGDWKKLDIQPVPKGQVQLKYKTSDGANVTIVKAKDAPEHDPRTLKEIASTPNYYKGKFNLVETVNGADDNTTRVYDSSKPSLAHEKEGSGAVVWVHRYPDKVTVQEQSYTKWSTKKSGLITFEYKNVGRAFGMLNRRYGIRIPIKGRF